MDKGKISETTIEALSRNFYKEAATYGFKYEHYLKFVNTLLEYALNGPINGTESKTSTKQKSSEQKFKKLPIETVEFHIRAFDKKKDSKVITDWLQDEYGRYFLISLSSSYKITLKQLLEEKDNILGMITKDEVQIGMVAFIHYDEEQKKAELRKLIGVPELRGKGYGKLATRHWINYGRYGLGLRKIYLNTVDTNIRNIRINEELGFKVEGILRDEVIIDKQFHDVLRMSLIFE